MSSHCTSPASASSGALLGSGKLSARGLQLGSALRGSIAGRSSRRPPRALPPALAGAQGRRILRA
eukprot:2856003-Pyramimonas_sp.AAC.1